MIVAWLFWCVPLHPVHLSVCEANYNPHSQNLELALKVFVEDMEQSLMERTGKEVRFGDDLTDARHDSLINVYLQEVFLVKADDSLLTWHMLGKDGQLGDMWIYMEVPLADGFQELVFEDKVLMDLFADQKNLIHFTYGEFKQSVACTVLEPVGRVLLGGSRQ